jgi:DNA primase
VQYFKCHGNCGAEGDVIDFVGYYYMGASYNDKNPESVRQAISYLHTRPMTGKRTQLKKQRKPMNPFRTRRYVERWERELKTCKAAQDYLERRGVLSVARQFRLGYEYVPPERTKYNKRVGGRLPGHYIAIPNFQSGAIRGVKFRRIDTHPDYKDENELPIRYDSLSGSRLGIFNFDAVAFQMGHVFIPEGEFDVMLLAATGYLSCCTTAGAETVDSNLELALCYAAPLIIRDPDPAGERGARKRLKLLGKGEIIPAGSYHDVGALFEAEGLSGLKQWADTYVLGNQGKTHYIGGAARHGAV